MPIPNLAYYLILAACVGMAVFGAAMSVLGADEAVRKAAGGVAGGSVFAGLMVVFSCEPYRSR